MQAVVNETYAFIWPMGAPAIDETDWSPAWLATDSARIIALMLSDEDCIEDLWVAASYRGQGIGTELLNIGEHEIFERGFAAGRLRVVAGNDVAKNFYKQRGWTFMRQYAHGRLPIEMMDFTKILPSPKTAGWSQRTSEIK